MLTTNNTVFEMDETCHLVTIFSHITSEEKLPLKAVLVRFLYNPFKLICFIFGLDLCSL